MSVEQPYVVDFVSTDPWGHIVLTIADHLDWSDEKYHIGLLQEKINNYVSFIESGEFYEAFPHARGRQLVIHVVRKCELPALAQEFHTHAATTLRRLNLDFTSALLADGKPS